MEMHPSTAFSSLKVGQTSLCLTTDVWLWGSQGKRPSPTKLQEGNAIAIHYTNYQLLKLNDLSLAEKRLLKYLEFVQSRWRALRQLSFGI